MFERLRSILHNSEIEKRVQYMVEVMFAIRKDGFKVQYKKSVQLVLYCNLFAFLGGKDLRIWENQPLSCVEILTKLYIWKARVGQFRVLCLGSCLCN